MLYLDSELPVDMTGLSRWATEVIDTIADCSDLDEPELNREAPDLLSRRVDHFRKGTVTAANGSCN
jgi:hypothetical protein